MIETRNVYEQLLELCQRDLANGRWKASERFPSERELVSEHGISRVTANKVISKLQSEGWLEIRKGLGAFVADRPTLVTSLRRIESFTDFAREQGLTPSTKVTRFARNATLPDDLRAEFPDAPKQSFIAIERLRFADDEAVIYEERWLPQPRYPRLKAAELNGSFYELCRQRYDYQVESEDSSLQAVSAPEHEAINWPCPALSLTGKGYDADGEALWYQRLYYRGDRFTLTNSTSAAGIPRISLHLSTQ